MRLRRPSHRINQLLPETPDKPADSSFNGKEDYRIPAESVVTAGPGQRTRCSRPELESLIERLSDRDFDVLTSLRQAKYLLTHQIERLHFANTATHASTIRATANAMRKLKGYGLVRHFPRPVGGIRAGSSSYIWYLTEAGQRLLNLKNHSGQSRRSHRYLEPSYLHVRHTLAISECFVQLVMIEKTHRKITLKDIQWEPECWRPYTKDSHDQMLKPDLFAVVNNGGYEDRWFIEIDLATEAMPVVMDKCRRYYHYYQTGKEQKEHQVFPITVWIVPDDKRKQLMKDTVKETFGSAAKLFVVIKAEEFESLIRNGAG